MFSINLSYFRIFSSISRDSVVSGFPPVFSLVLVLSPLYACHYQDIIPLFLDSWSWKEIGRLGQTPTARHGTSHLLDELDPASTI